LPFCAFSAAIPNYRISVGIVKYFILQSIRLDATTSIS